MIGPIGTLRSTPRGFFAQFSIGHKRRVGALLIACGVDEDAAIKRQTAIAELGAKLRESGHASIIKNTIKNAATIDAEGLRKLRTLVDRIAAGKEPGFAKGGATKREGVTVEELAKDWTSGKLAELYPDHVKVKKTSAGDATRFAYMNALRMPDGITFGDRDVAKLTLDDCDHVMRSLPDTTEAPASRRQYAQAIRKLLVYAVYPMRLRETIPIPQGWLPKNVSTKAKAWVYPSEDLALMRCREVPLARRLFFGFLAREGMRVSEARA